MAGAQDEREPTLKGVGAVVGAGEVRGRGGWVERGVEGLVGGVVVGLGGRDEEGVEFDEFHCSFEGFRVFSV